MVKVIFLQNINNYKVGEIKEVPNGYARNFLIPKEIACLATKEKIASLETKIKKLKSEEEKKVKIAEKIAEKIAKEEITLKEEVNEEGNMYGSVTAKEVSEALKKNNLEIEASMVVMEEPIKNLGKHTIKIAVGHGVETNLKLNVVRK